MKKRDERLPEIPQGSLGAAAMAAFNITASYAVLCFAKGNVKIDGEPLNATHLRQDALPYRGRYMSFYGRQALLVGHRLVVDNEQMSLI